MLVVLDPYINFENNRKNLTHTSASKSENDKTG